jgi:hypothetical protein
MLPSKNRQEQRSVHLYHRRTHSAPSTPTHRSPQASHGQEQEGSPPLPPTIAINEDRAYFNSPRPTTKSLTQRRSRSKGSHRSKQPHITYESPRLYHSDLELFPASKYGPLYNSPYLQSYEARYQYVQSLQGSLVTNELHQNDISTLRIHYAMIHDRKISPKAVQMGILPQCARWIRSLHCPILPQQRSAAVKRPRILLKAIISWIDMFVHTFPNLQHLYIQPPPLETDPLIAESAQGCEVSVSVKQPSPLFSPEEMKLFYTFIVYRIPTLQSIDGVFITTQDRKEAMRLKRVKGAVAPSVAHKMSDSSNPSQRCSSSPNRNSRLPLKAVPVKFCLLDGMEEDENNDPSQEDNIQTTETTVEVRQPSSEKKIPTHRPCTDRVVRSPNVYSHPHVFEPSTRKTEEEEQWEYVSVGESSVHAMGACASWTTACGSLSSAWPYFLQKRTADPNRLKMKLLQNRKRMIQGSISTAEIQNSSVTHGGSNERHLHTVLVERDQPTLHQPPTPSTEEKIPVPPSRSNLVRSMPNIPQHSLTFPMQFRSRPSVNIGTTLPETNVSEAAKGVEALKITANTFFTSKNSDPSCLVVPHTPRVSTSRDRITEDASFGMINPRVEKTYDLTRIRSSPSELPSSQRDAKATSSLTIQTKTVALPPPCPGATQRKMNATVNRLAYTTRPIPSPSNIPRCNSTTKAASLRRKDQSQNHPRTPQWRDAMSLRTFSLLDDEDEDHCSDGFVRSDDEDMLPLPSIGMP